MTLMLNLSPDQESAIRTQASKNGMEPEAYVLSLVDEAILFDGFEPIPQDDVREREETAAGVAHGLRDFAAGRHRSADDAFDELRTKHGIE